MAVGKGEYQVEIRVIDGNVKMKIDGITKGFIKLENGMKKLRDASLNTGDALENMGKKNLDMMNKSGLAGATLVELGRTISDMPYGIRGVANNLSQLSTLFVTLIATTGGFKEAMTVLKQTLGKGPLGIVLAFQAVLSLLDYFAGSTKKAEKATKDLTNAVSQQVIIVDELTEALDNNNITRQEGIDVAIGILKTEKRLKALLKENLITEEERNKKIIELAKLKKEELETETAISKLREKITKNNVDQQKTFLDIEKEKKELNKIGLNNAISRTLQQDVLNKLGTEFNKLQDDQVQNLKDLAELYNKQGIEVDKSSKKVEEYSDNVKDLKASMDFSELELKEGLRELDSFTMAQTERINFMSKFFVETSEQKIDRMEKESLRFLEILDDELELTGLNEKEKQKIRDYYNSIRGKDDKKFINELVDSVQQISSIFSEMTQAAYEADLSIEERRTTLANNNLKERLKNESLSAKQREGINAQIEANEEALQVKRDKLAKRQFENDKKVAIANALVNTYLAATDVLAREKLGLVGKIIAMTAVIGMGLAQVAAISRQQFVPSAMGAGGGAGGAGGASIQAPDFNVVGASQTSQLAETVAGQQSKPVKAFVVGKDISTQEELDRNITNTATLG